MARIDVRMPQMGESIAEGTVSKWLKQVGDSVQRDEPLFEISTDKVDAEVPAPAAGVLAEIKVAEGQTVPVQTLVAVMETDAGAARAAAPAAFPAAPPAPAAPSTPPRASVSSPAPASAPAPAPPPPASPRAPAVETGAAPGEGDGQAETPDERLRRKSTPLVRKIAAEHDVDLGAVRGTGVAGRVTKQDILDFIERGAAAPRTSAAPAAVGAPAAPAVPRQAPTPAAPAPAPTRGGGGPTGGGAPGGPVIHPAVEPWPGDRVEPFSRIRKITADHMILSRRTSAHVTSFFEVDYTKIAALRRVHKAGYAERGANLTFLAFIAKACAEQLRQHPVVNAAVSGDSIIYRHDVNIGIAVALDWGLIVPVVRHADELSLFGLARAINDLGERARAKKLSPEEIQRGTFTITNPGVFGSFVGAPIINQPQVAVLGVGAIEKRPRVMELPDGSDAIAIRSMGMVSLSYDHRIVDGADADRFLAAVKALLQDFPEGAV
jgi:pyruvate dehydrogenase E2 component (dihydrolipoyllysine-residue acetyltransferase)